MDIRTSQDVALIGCCECLPDECEVPRKECQSISAVAAPAGFTDPTDTVWKRYLTKSDATAYSLSVSTNTTEAEGTSYETTYVSYERTISANSANVQTYDRLFNGSVGGGGECGSWPATMTEECVATGTETIITRDALFATLAEGDPPTAAVVITSQTDITLSNVSGDRTVEHIAWEAEADAWDVANPDHAAAVAAWQADHDDWEDEVAAYDVAYQAWLDGGEVGDPPADVRPEPVRPPDRPTEPTEFYPECTFKKTTVETINDWAYYVYDDPAGEGLVLLDSTVTTSHEYIYGLPTWGGTATSTTTYGGGQGKAEWIAAVRAFLEGEMDFELLAAECLGSACASSIDVGPPDPPEEDPPLPPAPGPDPYIDMVKVRYRRGIPASWADFDGRHAAWVIAHAAWVIADPETRGDEPEEPTERTTYECQWDEGNFSVEWLAWEALKEAFDQATREHEEWVGGGSVGAEPDVPDDPGAAPEPVPTLVAARSWIYAPPNEFSEWFVMELPATPDTPVEILDVNLLVICYRSSALGQKPTAHGKVHEF